MARPAMNVVLATDGSAQARTAEELVGAMRWPGGTRITVVQVHELMPAMHGVPADVWQTVFDASRRWIDEHLEKVTAELSVTGREVAARSMTGRPASVIVDEARRIGADLIVVGSRGRGVVATTRRAPSSSPGLRASPASSLRRTARTARARRRTCSRGRSSRACRFTW